MGLQIASVPGTVAALCAVCSIILVFTGWRQVILPHASSYVLILGIGTWLWVTGLQLRVGETIWDLGWLLICLVAIAMFVQLWREGMNFSDCIVLCGQIAIIAALWMIVELLREAGDTWVNSFTPLLISVVVGVVVGIMYSSASSSFIVVTGVLLCKEWLVQARDKATLGMLFGTLSTADEWWMTFVVCRLSALILLYAERFVMYMRRE
ncbi:hypothetical protein NQ117_04780 [Paenibacillus sp. SC116]|uniref:hypothetical protein n=1 Tax=Paenibacillus sp. SC116 TaxID=2968986 RepID=UPI00215A91EE|nr:hypothetical protein [Paenibacillus sp. SC116]MCR8842987.1 hypothetical protein [Paenibacillus sp. SC116]